VVVINAGTPKVTGNKLEDKMYYRHSGYPGGLKEAQLKDVLDRTPDRAIYEAVRGMLPVNKLRDERLARLKIYAGPEHNHAAQKPEAISVKGTK
jgi:large subunit ribosomal protein L13